MTRQLPQCRLLAINARPEVVQSAAARECLRAFRTPHESLNERAYGKDVRVVTQPASAGSSIGFLKDVRVETRVEMPDRVYQANPQYRYCDRYYRRAVTATYRNRLMNCTSEDTITVAEQQFEQLKQEYQDAGSLCVMTVWTTSKTRPATMWSSIKNTLTLSGRHVPTRRSRTTLRDPFDAPLHTRLGVM